MVRTTRRAPLAMVALTLGALANGCGDGEGPTGPVPVASVAVTPNPASLRVGETFQLSAVAQDQAGNPLSGRNITWTSVNSTIASVVGGNVLGVSEGTTDISAVADGTAGTVTVTVDPPGVSSVEVRPTGVGVPLGETLQLTATPLDLTGTPLTGRTVGWSTSDAAVATVSTDGLVTGVAGGLVVITATVDQEAGEADIEVIDPTAPRISVVTPFPMVEGASATMIGVNFGATIGENAVTVDGVSAIVTAADPTSVTFTVPATGCAPHRDVLIQLTAGGKTGVESHPLRPTAAQIGIGEQLILTGPGAPCLRLDASQGFESYLIGVQSTSDNVNDLAQIELTAETGLGVGGPTSAAIAAAALAAAPVSSSAPAGPTQTGVQRMLRDQVLRHFSTREADRRLFSGGAYDFGPAAAGALQSVIPGDASVGDQFTVRVPGHFPGGCTQFSEVTAEIRVIRDRGYWLVDVDNPLGGFTDAQLHQMADEFENNVAPPLESMFGAIPDTDGNPRIAFVVTVKVVDEGWLSYPSLFDYLPVSQCAASNEGDWMYVATPVAGNLNFSAAALLQVFGPSFAHDFTHVIQNRAQIGGGQRVDTWIEEGQAALGSEVYTHALTQRSARQNYGSGTVFAFSGYNVVARLGTYYGFKGADEPKAVGAPEQCSWVNPVPAGTPLGPCDGGGGEGGAWAFLRWVTDHYAPSIGGDEAFHQDLIDGTGSGFDRVAMLTGVPIETLLARFAASLYADDRIAISDPLLEFPSWNLFDVEQNVFEQARLAPRNLGFTNFTQTGSVRAASTAYFTLSAAGHPATALEVTGPAGGALSPDIQVWAVRLQ